MDSFRVPLIIRGEIVEDADLTHGGRGGGVRFSAPDTGRHLDRLILTQSGALSDLYLVSFEEILDFLDALGRRLSLVDNHWLQEAFALSCRTSGLGPDILRDMYDSMGGLFAKAALYEVAERTIGVAHLEGWVETRLEDGLLSHIRAFGARSVHVVAGNAPGVSAMTIARNAMTRSDAIIKAPSNDPLTAAAIARTMIEMAPDHPLTKHLSVAYWRGGDIAIEEALYQPRHVEKIIAWGGMASIRHIARYIQPGIDLVTLDPKLSSTIIGHEAFEDDAEMERVAGLLAMDAGALNQEGCVNARVVYAHCGTDQEGMARLDHFGQMLWHAIQALPARISGPAVRLDPDLADEVDALKHGGGEWYRVIGGGRRGAVIVSQMDEPVDFARILANRVVNLVPVDNMDIPVCAVTGYTQTIGVYPERLKRDLRDRLAIQGAQRLVTLGHAVGMANHGIQDGIEPLRRMCRWIVDEERVTPGSMREPLALQNVRGAAAE